MGHSFSFSLHWVFFARGLTAVSGATLLAVEGFSLWWLLLLQSLGSRHTSSAVAAPGPQSTGFNSHIHGLRGPTACGVSLGQGLNPCPLHWQVVKNPLHHQGVHAWDILSLKICLSLI